MTCLGSIATARSRRAGSHVTLDVAVASADHYARLVDELSVERLHHLFAELEVQQIRRFELPNLLVLHFVLYEAFASGSAHWFLDGEGTHLAQRVLALDTGAGDS